MGNYWGKVVTNIKSQIVISQLIKLLYQAIENKVSTGRNTFLLEMRTLRH